jgi:hypothetical protein
MNARLASLVAACLLFAAPVLAQSYVAAAVGVDISRNYETSSGAFSYSEGSGEDIHWALRAGTSIGSLFGVEFEFVRPGAIDVANSPVVLGGGDARALAAVTAITMPSVSIFPTPQVTAEQRNSTYNAAAWVRKPLNGSLDLVFLGGLGFSRVVQEVEFNFPNVLLAQAAVPRPSSARITSYGVGPLVGTEARIRLAEHVRITPGIRVQSLGNDLASGLLIRPSVAIAWSF